MRTGMPMSPPGLHGGFQAVFRPQGVPWQSSVGIWLMVKKGGNLNPTGGGALLQFLSRFFPSTSTTSKCFQWGSRAGGSPAFEREKKVFPHFLTRTFIKPLYEVNQNLWSMREGGHWATCLATRRLLGSIPASRGCSPSYALSKAVLL